MTAYQTYIIETYLNIRKALAETQAGDNPVWNALVGSLNLVQDEMTKNNINHEDIEAVKVG